MTEVSATSCACAASEPLPSRGLHSCRVLQGLRPRERQTPREPTVAAKSHQPPAAREHQSLRRPLFLLKSIATQIARTRTPGARSPSSLAAHLSACWESEDDVHHPHLRRVPVLRTACLSTPSSCAPASSLTTRSGRSSDAIRAQFGHSSTLQSRPSLASHGRPLMRRPLSLGGRGWNVGHLIAPMRAMTPRSWSVMRAGDEPTARKRAHGHARAQSSSSKG
jgi:hypothetical protein